jgi:hypothetical protein
MNMGRGQDGSIWDRCGDEHHSSKLKLQVLSVFAHRNEPPGNSTPSEDGWDIWGMVNLTAHCTQRGQPFQELEMIHELHRTLATCIQSMTRVLTVPTCCLQVESSDQISCSYYRSKLNYWSGYVVVCIEIIQRWDSDWKEPREVCFEEVPWKFMAASSNDSWCGGGPISMQRDLLHQCIFSYLVCYICKETFMDNLLYILIYFNILISYHQYCPWYYKN